MAWICSSSSLVLGFLLLLLPFHHASSVVTPTSVSTITFLSKHSNETDRQALVTLKSAISIDPSGSLASWNDSVHFYRWLGVTCGGRRHPQRVVSLSLSSLDLVGFIPPVISNLTFIRKIDISDNQFHGSIPEEIALLFRLRHLNLSLNSLEGVISTSLSSCVQLRNISLRNNMLTGEIPPSLSYCLHLQILSLDNNSLSGGIPSSIGNLTSLTILNLAYNSLTGTIPSTIANLHSLTYLYLDFNQLSGGIPPSLGNLSSLVIFGLSANALTGSIPFTVGKLASLTYLHLHNNSLSGCIPPVIGNLTSLTSLLLHSNEFGCSIPPSIGNLFSLTYLTLDYNQLSGGIPPSLGNLSSLEIFGLSANALTGSIKFTIGKLASLTYLYLHNNSLSGCIPPVIGNLNSLTSLLLHSNEFGCSIPPSIGNLFSLTYLILYGNKLSGDIPSSLGKLFNLTARSVGFNNLSGVVPPSLWNISSLTYLYLADNNLSGPIPPNLSQLLPMLVEIVLYNNRFHGPIPPSLSNASSLSVVDLSLNRFSGAIPLSLGLLQNLTWLSLSENLLDVREPDGWGFLTALANCTRLEVLSIMGNNLSGTPLPDSVANLSTKLVWLDMSSSYISGKISPYIGNLVNLTMLYMAGNSLTGSIPASIGMLQKLHRLYLHSNKLSGDIPLSIGNLTQLNTLYLFSNELSGNIPASLRNCQNLLSLHLGYNRLTGVIPKEVLTISALSIILNLSYNSLTGPIPAEIGNLKNLGVIDVGMNKLSGEIPSRLGDCQVMEELYLEGNFLQGSIPIAFGSLKGLRKLDISMNNFSGNIPYFLQDLHVLYYLNLSFNNLEGEVPRLGVFHNASAVSLIGNYKLCGGSPEMHLPACHHQSPMRSWAVAVIVGTSSVLLFLIMLSCFLIWQCWRKGSRRKHHDSSAIKEQYGKISYSELARATDGFSADNIIGMGSFGTVYKGILDEGSRTSVVAVKVLNLQTRGASKSFIAECEAVRNIRHRNLVKILTTCSSIDFGGNEFKAVVFEFMDNGSLDDWLHPRASDQQSEPKRLNLMQRLNIAIDVASALDYIHHYGKTPIIHCDLKPSNILLDGDMSARVGDFGLARFLMKASSKSSTSSVGLKGTVGYIAPEYGMANKVSTYGDVYSYGIVLLEMFTGKRPTDDAFGGGLSLRQFVEMAFPSRILDVVDARLVLTEDSERAVECIASVLRIAMSCSNELPAERMEMGDMIRELHQVKDLLVENEAWGGEAELKEMVKVHLQVSSDKP